MKKSTVATVTALMALMSIDALSASWDVSSETDRMTNKVVTTASLSSDNSLSLPFPYNGSNKGTIFVRRNGKADEVAFAIERGQLMCRSYSPCTVSIKFENRPVIKFQGVGNTSGKATVTFLNNESAFVKEASKSKKMLVEVELYQVGRQVFEFTADAQLSWPPNKK